MKKRYSNYHELMFIYGCTDLVAVRKKVESKGYTYKEEYNGDITISKERKRKGVKK